MKKKTLLLILLMTLLAPWAVAQNQLNEGFESATFPPEEWSTIHVSGNNSWARSTSYHHNGNACAYAHWASAGHNNYMITPKLEPQSGESLSFFVSAQSYSGTTLYVKVSTTTPEASAFSTTLATYTTGSSGTIGTTSDTNFVEKIIDVSSYAGQQIYIAFHIVDSNGGDIYIDDVTGVTLYVPACPKPTGLTATLTPGNGTIATLNWTAGGEETAWVLEYGTASDFTGATSVNVSGTPSKDLTGLTAETTYYARVKADCGGDYSDWCSTVCEFTPTNQYIISILGETSSTYYYLPAHTNYDYAYTQQIYTAEEMGGFPCTLESIAFNGNKAAVCTWDIYLANTTKSSFTGSSDYIDINEATLVFSGEVTFTANDWTTIAFDNEFDYEGENIVVIVDDNSGNYVYGSTTWQTFNTTTIQALYFFQDNTNYNPASPSGGSSGTASKKNQIKFDYELPSPYAKPKNLVVSDLTAHTATITWEAPSTEATGYKYQYKPEGGTWSVLTQTSNLSAPLTGLTGNTTYEFQVQAIYAGNNESNFASKTFTTECEYAIPYSYGFETSADMDCWATLDCEEDVTNYLNGVITSTEYAHSGDNFFSFSSYNGTTDPQYLFSPLLSGISEGLHVEFYYRSLQADDPETFMVGYSTTDRDPDHFTWGNEITSPDDNYNIFKANYPANTRFIAVKYTSGDSFYLFLDDFTFEEASSCLEPTNVTASGITTEEATIDWTIGKEETEWDIYYTDDMTDVPDDSTTPIVEGTSTKPYTLVGLSDATTYYVYVRAVCGSSETSAWSSPCTFHTECYGLDMPMSTYSFEDSELTVCWNTYSDNIAYNRAKISDDEAHTGTNSLEFYRGSQTGDLIVTLPEVKHAYPMDWYQFDFWAMADASDLIITIGIMEDPNDPTTFVAQGAGIEPESSFSEYKVRFNEYTGDGHYVAIMVTREGSKGSVYVDDVAIQVIPSCIEPEALNVSDETAHGAKFEWTTGGSETEWHLYISESNTAPDDDIPLSKVTVADSNPFTLTTGLDPETTYYVWVRANCGDTDGYSMWVGPETFTTAIACPAPTDFAASEITGHTAKLSWTGTSESYKVSYRTAAYVSSPVLNEEFSTSTFPSTWSRSSTALTDDVLNGTTTINTVSNGWSTTTYGLGEYNVKMNIWYTSKYWLITPSTILGDNNMLFFDAAITAYNSNSAPASDKMPDANSRFVVLITTDDQATWTILREWNNTGSADVLNNISNTGNNFSIDLSSYSGETVKIAFYGGQTASGPDCDLHIDNVMIGEAVPAGTWTTKTTDASPYQITGLLAETKYEAKVQGDCGSEGLSAESASLFFTTDVACPAPTGFAVEAVGSNYALLNWNLGVNDAWQVELTDVTHATVPSTINVNAVDVIVDEGVVTFQINLSNPENEYSVRLRANCESAGEGYSEWTSPLAFTTIAACSAMDVTFENITHHNVTVNWNGESDDDFTVYYCETPGFDPAHTLIDEGFEAGEIPTGWTIEGDNQEASKTWRVGVGDYSTSTGTHSGSYNALITHNNKTDETYLITPTLDLSTLTAVAVDLWYINRKWSSDTDAFGVYYRVDGGAWNEIFATTDAHSTWTEIRSSLPAGALAANCQIGFKMTDGYGYGVGIDDIIIGSMEEAQWQTKDVEGNTTNLTSLEAGTNYDVRVVPNCNPSLGTPIANFKTEEANLKYFLTAGDWATTNNWMDGEIPTITDNAIINANVNVTETAAVNNINLNSNVLTIVSGASLTINGNVTNGGSDKIIVQDGGQLIHTNEIYATVQKNVAAASSWGKDDIDGWYLIATPASTYASNVFTGAIDLFKYDEPTSYWWSYNNGSHTFNSITIGVGYLHASQATQTESYAGYMLSTEDTWTSSTMSYTSSLTDDVRGFNLMGNPFSRNLVAGDVKWGDETNIAYLAMNDTHTGFTAYNIGDRPIMVGEGFFFQATADGQALEFNPTSAKSDNNGYIRIVAGNENGTDNAYINVASGNTLRKFNIANGTKVYVMNGGEDYSAARIDELAGSMPVNFKPAAEGVYTITINAKNLEANTMILIDNMTGEEVDLLATPSYTFKATPDDSYDRFRLIFDFNTYTGIDELFTNEIFAFQSGSEIYVKGEGTLEVFDVMGRMVLNTRINGVERVNVPANAVYIFKLEEKTQKIVVR